MAIASQTGTQLIDDFLRRELRVGDPKDAREVAIALRTRYASASALIDQEGAGYSIAYQADSRPVSTSTRQSASQYESQRLRDALDADFRTLIEEPANRERRPELTGWHETVMDELNDGLASALMAKDPSARERTFYAIRKLSSFARVSRLAGVSYQELFYPYRRLASSLDACGNLLRVTMGEALYYGGLSDGGLIVSMPLTDLRAQRDGLVVALRQLTGVAEGTSWPDALVSYRGLREAIERERRSELLVYLREESLVPVLDDLVADASPSSPTALRELAAGGLVDVTNLSELLALITDAQPPVPSSPSLAQFTENLHLFITFFGVSSAGPVGSRRGARLTQLAVPVPLASLGASIVDAEARSQLIALVGWRHVFAVFVDTALPAPQAASERDLQVEADVALYAIDRAIDYFSQGQALKSAWAIEERGAAFYMKIVDKFLTLASATLPTADLSSSLPMKYFEDGTPQPDDPIAGSIEGPILGELGRAMLTWNDMVRSLSPR